MTQNTPRSKTPRQQPQTPSYNLRNRTSEAATFSTPQHATTLPAGDESPSTPQAAVSNVYAEPPSPSSSQAGSRRRSSRRASRRDHGVTTSSADRGSYAINSDLSASDSLSLATMDGPPSMKNLRHWRKIQLIEECKRLGISYRGTKLELAQRIMRTISPEAKSPSVVADDSDARVLRTRSAHKPGSSEDGQSRTLQHSTGTIDGLSKSQLRKQTAVSDANEGFSTPKEDVTLRSHRVRSSTGTSKPAVAREADTIDAEDATDGNIRHYDIQESSPIAVSRKLCVSDPTQASQAQIKRASQSSEQLEDTMKSRHSVFNIYKPNSVKSGAHGSNEQPSSATVGEEGSSNRKVVTFEREVMEEKSVLSAGVHPTLEYIPAETQDSVVNERDNGSVNEEENDSVANEEGNNSAANEVKTGMVASEGETDMVANEGATDMATNEGGSGMVTNEGGSDMVTNEGGSDMVTNERGSDMVTNERGSDMVTNERGSDMVANEGENIQVAVNFSPSQPERDDSPSTESLGQCSLMPKRSEGEIAQEATVVDDMDVDFSANPSNVSHPSPHQQRSVDVAENEERTFNERSDVGLSETRNQSMSLPDPTLEFVPRENVLNESLSCNANDEVFEVPDSESRIELEAAVHHNEVARSSAHARSNEESTLLQNGNFQNSSSLTEDVTRSISQPSCLGTRESLSSTVRSTVVTYVKEVNMTEVTESREAEESAACERKDELENLLPSLQSDLENATTLAASAVRESDIVARAFRAARTSIGVASNRAAIPCSSPIATEKPAAYSGVDVAVDMEVDSPQVPNNYKSGNGREALKSSPASQDNTVNMVSSPDAELQNSVQGNNIGGATDVSDLSLVERKATDSTTDVGTEEIISEANAQPSGRDREDMLSKDEILTTECSDEAHRDLGVTPIGAEVGSMAPKEIAKQTASSEQVSVTMQDSAAVDDRAPHTLQQDTDKTQDVETPQLGTVEAVNGADTAEGKGIENSDEIHLTEKVASVKGTAIPDVSAVHSVESDMRPESPCSSKEGKVVHKTFADDNVIKSSFAEPADSPGSTEREDCLNKLVEERENGIQPSNTEDHEEKSICSVDANESLNCETKSLKLNHMPIDTHDGNHETTSVERGQVDPTHLDALDKSDCPVDSEHTEKGSEQKENVVSSNQTGPTGPSGGKLQVPKDAIDDFTKDSNTVKGSTVMDAEGLEQAPSDIVAIVQSGTVKEAPVVTAGVKNGDVQKEILQCAKVVEPVDTSLPRNVDSNIINEEVNEEVSASVPDQKAQEVHVSEKPDSYARTVAGDKHSDPVEVDRYDSSEDEIIAKTGCYSRLTAEIVERESRVQQDVSPAVPKDLSEYEEDAMDIGVKGAEEEVADHSKFATETVVRHYDCRAQSMEECKNVLSEGEKSLGALRSSRRDPPVQSWIGSKGPLQEQHTDSSNICRPELEDYEVAGTEDKSVQKSSYSDTISDSDNVLQRTDQNEEASNNETNSSVPNDSNHAHKHEKDEAEDDSDMELEFEDKGDVVEKAKSDKVGSLDGATVKPEWDKDSADKSAIGSAVRRLFDNDDIDCKDGYFSESPLPSPRIPRKIDFLNLEETVLPGNRQTDLSQNTIEEHKTSNEVNHFGQEAKLSQDQTGLVTIIESESNLAKNKDVTLQSCSNEDDDVGNLPNDRSKSSDEDVDDDILENDVTAKGIDISGPLYHTMKEHTSEGEDLEKDTDNEDSNKDFSDEDANEDDIAEDSVAEIEAEDVVEEDAVGEDDSDDMNLDNIVDDHAVDVGTEEDSDINVGAIREDTPEQEDNWAAGTDYPSDDDQVVRTKDASEESKSSGGSSPEEYHSPHDSSGEAADDEESDEEHEESEAEESHNAEINFSAADRSAQAHDVISISLSESDELEEENEGSDGMVLVENVDIESDRTPSNMNCDSVQAKLESEDIVGAQHDANSTPLKIADRSENHGVNDNEKVSGAREVEMSKKPASIPNIFSRQDSQSGILGLQDDGIWDVTGAMDTSKPALSPEVSQFRDPIKSTSYAPRISGNDRDEVGTLLRETQSMLAHLRDDNSEANSAAKRQVVPGVVGPPLEVGRTMSQTSVPREEVFAPPPSPYLGSTVPVNRSRVIITHANKGQVIVGGENSLQSSEIVGGAHGRQPVNTEQKFSLHERQLNRGAGPALQKEQSASGIGQSQDEIGVVMRRKKRARENDTSEDNVIIEKSVFTSAKSVEPTDERPTKRSRQQEPLLVEGQAMPTPAEALRGLQPMFGGEWAKMASSRNYDNDRVCDERTKAILARLEKIERKESSKKFAAFSESSISSMIMSGFNNNLSTCNQTVDVAFRIGTNSRPVGRVRGYPAGRQRRTPLRVLSAYNRETRRQLELESLQHANQAARQFSTLSNAVPRDARNSEHNSYDNGRADNGHYATQRASFQWSNVSGWAHTPSR